VAFRVIMLCCGMVSGYLRCHNLEENMNIHCRENLKLYVKIFLTNFLKNIDCSYNSMLSLNKSVRSECVMWKFEV
jgi:hypothetical protein